jgi:hypothetical protein
MKKEGVPSVFGDAIDCFSSGKLPKGVETVATTLVEPGPLLDEGCPLHGVGCPPECPVLKAYDEYVHNPPPRCK